MRRTALWRGGSESDTVWTAYNPTGDPMGLVTERRT